MTRLCDGRVVPGSHDSPFADLPSWKVLPPPTCRLAQLPSAQIKNVQPTLCKEPRLKTHRDVVGTDLNPNQRQPDLMPRSAKCRKAVLAHAGRVGWPAEALWRVCTPHIWFPLKGPANCFLSPPHPKSQSPPRSSGDGSWLTGPSCGSGLTERPIPHVIGRPGEAW